MLGIEDVGRDLRPVHPAALRLARIVQHAGGQLQFGVGELVRRGGGGEIRHRIVGRIEAIGGGVLQAGDHALGAVGQLAGLGPLRRIFARAVEFLDRGALVLAVEIAQRLAAEHFAQFVGDRLIGRGTLLAAFTGSLAGSAAGAWRSRRRGAAVAVSRVVGLRRRGDDRRPARWGSAAVAVRRLARLRGRLVGRLGRIGHRGGGIDLEIADARRRDVGRFGARDCGIDREFCGAGARRIRLGSARAEVADTARKVAATAIRTRSNPARLVEQSRIVTPPWAKLPRHGTVVRYRSSQLARKAPASIGSVGTPARNDSNADDTCAPFMQPAPCGATHDKLTSNNPFAFGWRGFATPPAVCLSPASHGSKVPEQPCRLVRQHLCHRSATIAAFAQSASCAPPSAGSLAAASSSLR